jgi:benzoyl-CoA reductase subunit BamC
MCESNPPLEKPMCVQACEPGCLTYEEREVEEEEKKEGTKDQMEIGLESLIQKHGLKTVRDTLARLSKG